MSTGWENHEPAPLEFFHARLMELFHEYRREKVGQAQINVSMDGRVFGNLIARAKNDTYAKYPKHVNQNAILKIDI